MNHFDTEQKHVGVADQVPGPELFSIQAEIDSGAGSRKWRLDLVCTPDACGLLDEQGLVRLAKKLDALGLSRYGDLLRQKRHIATRQNWGRLRRAATWNVKLRWIPDADGPVDAAVIEAIEGPLTAQMIFAEANGP